MGAGRPTARRCPIAAGTGIIFRRRRRRRPGARARRARGSHPPPLRPRHGVLRTGRLHRILSGSGSGITSARLRSAASLTSRSTEWRTRELPTAGTPSLPRASRVLRRLGEATASLVNLMDPAAVILSGSMTRSDTFLVGRPREVVEVSAMDAFVSTPHSGWLPYGDQLLAGPFRSFCTQEFTMHPCSLLPWKGKFAVLPSRRIRARADAPPRDDGDRAVEMRRRGHPLPGPVRHLLAIKGRVDVPVIGLVEGRLRGRLHHPLAAPRARLRGWPGPTSWP